MMHHTTTYLSQKAWLIRQDKENAALWLMLQKYHVAESHSAYMMPYLTDTSPVQGNIWHTGKQIKSKLIKPTQKRRVKKEAPADPRSSPTSLTSRDPDMRVPSLPQTALHRDKGLHLFHCSKGNINNSIPFHFTSHCPLLYLQCPTRSTLLRRRRKEKEKGASIRDLYCFSPVSE